VEMRRAAAAALDSERLAEESFEWERSLLWRGDDRFDLERGHDQQLMWIGVKGEATINNCARQDARGRGGEAAAGGRRNASNRELC
jgi:hypothetical protein